MDPGADVPGRGPGVVARLEFDPPVWADAAGGRPADDPAVVDVDAPGDGPGPGGRPGTPLRAAAGPVGAGRLRRDAAGHAADAPALRPVLPAAGAWSPAPGPGGRDRRAGDQLLGVRGRDLPGG